MANRKKFFALDGWVYCKGDATDSNIDATKRGMRESFAHVPGIQVRVFKRNVKAANASIPVTVIVARAPIPDKE